MRIAEEVAQIIVERMRESGSPHAVRIETAEITRITGFVSATIVEEIRRELAADSLVFVEVPSGGFAVADPRMFIEAPALYLARPRKSV
jgi:hypothetical protein